MKIAISIALSVLMSLSSYAQETTDNYFTNLDDAKLYAEANDANILMVFGGSDWCRPCIKFKKEILDATDFKGATKGNIAVLYLDFPSKRKNKLSKEVTQHNEALAAKWNTSGTFPKIVLIDKEMTKIKEIAYEGQTSGDFILSL